MPKLPVVSGHEAVKRFEALGYKVIRIRGSHIRMKYKDTSRDPLTIPNHATLGKGLLRKLLRDAHITVSEFQQLR
ncbi:MAG: type II toxin-antitoxin system HicA family toxin [Candidatus Peribacteraceae bacterium]|nr:type II toxin-antitoxin system HicA family toxin [Candidatus Peribacteraceae bacterium]